MSKSLGSQIDEMIRLTGARDALEAQVGALEKVISQKREKLLSQFKKSELDGARGKLGVASIIERDIPQIADPKKFYAYVKSHDAFDLLQKRVSTEAWRERSQGGAKIPGIGVFHDVQLRVGKVR